MAVWTTKYPGQKGYYQSFELALTMFAEQLAPTHKTQQYKFEDKYQALLVRAVRLRHKNADAAVMRQQEKFWPLFTDKENLTDSRRLFLEPGLGVRVEDSDVWSAVRAAEVSAWNQWWKESSVQQKGSYTGPSRKKLPLFGTPLPGMKITPFLEFVQPMQKWVT